MSMIPKIKIEMTLNELEHVTDCFAMFIPEQSMSSREMSLTTNILQLLCEKLLKKQLAKRHETKPFKVSFEYFEAHTLEKFLIMCNRFQEQHYVQTVINKLNQKLA